MGAGSTAVYFQQAEIVKEHFTTVGSGAGSIEAATTKYFATINLFVSLLTVFIQLFVFRALYNRFGVSFCLVVLPCMYVVGLFCLGVAPSIEVLSVVGVLGRSCEYGIFNPSKEGLFTVVSRSERYKAKSFIDTIMRRSGDSMVGSVYQTLRETLYVPGFAVAFGTIPIAAWMTYLGYSIGKKTERISTGLAD